MDSKKIIFFDIDGTLVNYSCTMPESTKKALTLLRQNGHSLVVSTGRSKSEVYPWLLDMPWDGLICAAGAYVEWNNDIVHAEYMTDTTLKILTDYIESHGGTYILEGSTDIWEKESLMASNKIFMAQWISSCHGSGSIMPIPEAVPFSTLSQVHHIHKLNFHGLNIDVSIMENQLNAILLEAKMPPIHAIRFNMGNVFNSSGEITLEGVHKSYGIEKLLSASGFSINDSIAFGDSMNDYEMLQTVSIGVAMGNACDALKNIADIVTTHIDEDGIYTGVKRLGLI